MMILRFNSTVDRDNVAMGLLHAGYSLQQQTVDIGSFKNEFRLIIAEPVPVRVAETALDIMKLLKQNPEAYSAVCMYIQACCDDIQK